MVEEVIGMEDASRMPPRLKTNADYEAAIAETKRLHEQTKSDQADIEASKAKTLAMLAEIRGAR